MPDIQKMLTAAHLIKQQYDEFLLHANVTDSGEARIAASLYLTISEQFDATLCLVENEIASHAPILVRSMLEGLANLINLVNDADYLNQIRFEDARSNIILFDAYAADPEMRKDAAAIATLAEWRNISIPVRDELAGKGFKDQRVITKFKNAKIEPLYLGYRVFCSITHNQLTALMARHSGPFLRYHHEAPTELIASTLTCAVAILTNAVKLSPMFSDIPEAEIQASMDKADADWTEAQRESPAT